MKRLISIALLVAALAADIPTEVGNLETKAGKKYSGVTITEKREDGISIRHETGTARIPFEQIPDDLAQQLGGFDSEKAAKARAAANEEERAARDSIEKGLRNQQASEAATKKAAQDYATAKPAVLDVVQVNGSDALCRVAWSRQEIHFRTITDAFGRTKQVPMKKIGVGEFEKPLFWVQNVRGVADDDQIVARLQETEEMKTYTTSLRTQATVRILRLVDPPAPPKEKQ